MKRKSFIQYGILFILLVVFPAVSWLYLRKGMSYREKMLERLSPVVEAVVVDSTLRSHICVITFNYPEVSEPEPILSVKELLIDQESVIFLERGWEEMNDTFNEAWSMCFPESNANAGDRIFLINRQGYIVNCYRVTNSEDIAALPEDIAFLLPPDKRQTLLFRREREK